MKQIWPDTGQARKGPSVRAVAKFDLTLHHGGPESSFILDVNSNWKLAVENYSESYHLPWVHPGLNSYSRLQDHYNIVEYGHPLGGFSGRTVALS